MSEKKLVKGKGLPMVIFDLETTGFSPIRDRIVEIGAIKVRDNAIVGRFNRLVNPECHIPSVATSVHHITDEMVEKQGTIEQILPGFLEFITQDTLVAHNASFDMGFINSWVEKLGLPKPQNPVICTLQLSCKTFPSLKSHKLGELARVFHIPTIIQHRALNDVETTWQIYKILAEK
ncbi:MAG: 3'-5' exonuclease [Candidatus Latescibacterota bacterium]|nr:3'-5' exonuclease [Candidatus Latescibacterota bacterium]